MSEIDLIIARLEQVIRKSGLKYTQLESKTGISKSSLQRYATGVTKKVPVDAILAVAQVLNVSPAWIMGWSDDCNDKTTDTLATFPLTPHEKQLIISYRAHPEMQPAVDTLLGVEKDIKKEDLA